MSRTIKTIIKSLILSSLIAAGVSWGQPPVEGKFPPGTVKVSPVVQLVDWPGLVTKEFQVAIKPFDERYESIIVMVCIEDDGSLTPVQVTKVDAKKGVVSFVTAHGGRYQVVYLKEFKDFVDAQMKNDGSKK